MLYLKPNSIFLPILSKDKYIPVNEKPKEESPKPAEETIKSIPLTQSQEGGNPEGAYLETLSSSQAAADEVDGQNSVKALTIDNPAFEVRV